MTAIPLPGLKPQEGGGYAVCPKCVLTWLIIIAVVGAAVYYAKQKAII